jgi:hypothetical protein
MVRGDIRYWDTAPHLFGLMASHQIDFERMPAWVFVFSIDKAVE